MHKLHKRLDPLYANKFLLINRTYKILMTFAIKYFKATDKLFESIDFFNVL